ncbi:MAG: 16S rRNA (cytidine(1402)-2'-O)-methyltransferase [Nitrospirae bacterium]|nr:MAG: hypothetical protein D084_Lepto4C00426G0010 [Leptospirillum sp. Group IV 'UBA BS']MCL4484937.1 16S rRNA (cytidine(1402)-2'-O)-methyltransferase [Nitrospirota bacterium]MCL5284714.1 16S rRNA (cytidine(1402)-2'-O)-methyltransferase [Nitrospirota bacterium]
MYDHPSGALYLVSTPIGNLKDITVRALDVLGKVHFVASEDTRVTRHLLDHYGIPTPCVSYHEHNREEKIPVFLHRMEKGESIALVSDAGTPLVSDPGSALVSETIARGLPVHPVPGPSSILAALSASGLLEDRFFFGGFLPRGKGDMERLLADLARRTEVLVFFETPKRIGRTLETMEEVLGPERRVTVAREMTKLHESFYRGRLPEVRTLLASAPLLGEMVLVVEGASPDQESMEVPSAVLEALKDLDVSRADKARFLSRAYNLPRKIAYRLAEKNFAN